MTPAGAAERDAATNRDRARRAWLVLVAGFLAFTLSAGIMHAHTVFLLAFIAEFAWTRAEASIAYSVGQVVAGASPPLVGGMMDRLGPRRMVLLGGCLLAAGLVLSASARSLWQVVVLYGVVMTVGANCVGMVVFVPLVSRLFVARRGPRADRTTASAWRSATSPRGVPQRSPLVSGSAANHITFVSVSVVAHR